MKRTFFLYLVVSACLFMSQFTYGTSSDDIIAGPENQGLRMKLHIKNADGEKADVYKVSISLINVGTTPVILVALWDDEKEKGDYSEFLKKQVSLISFPEVCVHSAQTEVPQERTSPQPTLVIKPDYSVSVEWITAPRLLKPEGYYNTIPDTFPSDGLYSIRAGFLAVSKGGKRILLYSNDYQLAVGGSTKLPKFAVAPIVQCDPANGKVLLGLGSDHQIKPNDKFTTGAFGRWEILITEVEDTTSTGLVRILRRDPIFENEPVFPKVGRSAALVPVLPPGKN